jgi:hypothetical protein
MLVWSYVGSVNATSRASKSKICINIRILEGKPDKSNPLRGAVAALELTAIENYAIMIGCDEIEVQERAAGAIPVLKASGCLDPRGQLVIAIEQ